MMPSYSFLPWLRTGIAGTITTADGDTGVKTRATVNVSLQASGASVGGGPAITQNISQDIALYGPGDIIGVDAKAVIRTDPHAWITNYEANYLAAVEFYDEDFPWRYTPAAPDGSGLHLRPWIFLLVLKEDEFTEGRDTVGRPLPYIVPNDASVFPPAPDIWAWAHVHFNQTVAGGPTELVSPDMASVLPLVQTLIEQNRDVAYSRIVSPRRLDDDTGYYAFVVPTFETGRLAGLGNDPTGAPHATFTAWQDYAGKADPTFVPVYYRWYFRTGAKGDFEYLVSLLKAQAVDSRVGTRDMDVLDPGSNIPPIADPALDGVLPLGGALRVPDADLSPGDLQRRQTYEGWDQPYPHIFEKAVAAFVNLPDAYAEQSAGDANVASGLGPGVSDDPDPLITSPLYGRWHALTKRLLTNRDGSPAPNNTNWVHRLNLDPRFRVPAAFGASVVETNTEDYMNDAWQQIGDVLAANQKIRQLQLALGVSRQWYIGHFTPLAATNGERAFALAAPIAGRVVSGGATIAATQNASLVPPTVTSAAFRRVLRPGARLMRALPFDSTVTPGNLLGRINAGAVSAAPPKPVPTAIPSVDQAAGVLQPPGAPAPILALLAKYPWLPVALLGAAAILGLIALLILIPVSLAIGLILLSLIAGTAALIYFQLKAWQLADGPAQALAEANQVPSAVTRMPANPNFQLTDPGSTLRPQPGATDSTTATRFKTALGDWYTLRLAGQAAASRPAPSPLDLSGLTTAVVGAINPSVTIPRRGLSILAIPDWIRQLIGDAFGEVMAYPKIDLPMYKPLKDISSELFLPNINLIPDNSITLIESNQRFIEAYMVGLNHEFSRKLLWRGYPTDQRGSYFRQFWDVGSYIDSEGLSTNALKEKLYDIPPLDQWSLTSALGDHNNRITDAAASAQAVLVIRGELLKRYPTAVIFAQHAKWALKNGKIDLTQPRSLDELTSAEEANPPVTKIRSPLYEAKVDPDIYFFGFDLTVAEAKGQSGKKPTDDPGWFFVIQQRPGEPRFGLELTRPGPITIFDRITWDDVAPAVAPGQFLSAASLAPVTLATPQSSDPDLDQHADDAVVDAAAPSSARWAYVLLRAPVMVAVHADQMLA
jgi:hypothetical protein